MKGGGRQLIFDNTKHNTKVMVLKEGIKIKGVRLEVVEYLTF